MGLKNTALTKPLQSKAARRAATLDSFQNFTARLGMGTNNQMSSSTYGYNPITRVRTLLEWIHRGSWLGGVAVDVVADDMTRAGVTINGTMDPDDIKKIEDAALRLNIWGAVSDTIKWSRLYGGAIGVIMIDGQELSTPLNADSIGKGSFRGVLPLDRWMLDTHVYMDVVTEMGPDIGKPMFYRVIASGALRGMKIHYSRVFRLEGTQLSYWQRISENGWGASVLERLYDRMIAYDSATTGAAQLVYKSYLRTIKIDELRDIIAQGGDMLDGLVKYVDMMARFQSIEGITLLDNKDTFETHNAGASFSGLNDALTQFASQLAGALQIPLVRLLGQSPGGLNATGESDMRIYYDSILQQQKRHLYTPVNKVYRCMALSEGLTFDESFAVDFNPLWQLEEGEKVDIATKVATMVGDLVDRGIYTPELAVKDLQQNANITGYFSNIDDEYVNSLKDMGPPEATEVRAANARSEGEEESAEVRAGGGDEPSTNDHRTVDGWITLRKKTASGGENKEGGGAHVFVSGGHITKGPADLAGKNLDDLKDTHHVQPKNHAEPLANHHSALTAAGWQPKKAYGKNNNTFYEHPQHPEAGEIKVDTVGEGTAKNRWTHSTGLGINHALGGTTGSNVAGQTEGSAEGPTLSEYLSNPDLAKETAERHAKISSLSDAEKRAAVAKYDSNLFSNTQSQSAGPKETTVTKREYAPFTPQTVTPPKTTGSTTTPEVLKKSQEWAHQLNIELEKKNQNSNRAAADYSGEPPSSLLDAFDYYQDDETLGADNINNYLWKNAAAAGSTDFVNKEDKAAMNALTKSIAKTTNKAPMRLFRGCGEAEFKAYFDKAPEGVIFEYPGFMSTTVNKTVASNYAGEGGYTVEVYAGPGHNMVNVESVTGADYGDEEEVLVQRGSKYRLLSKDSKKRTIKLELVK